MFSSLAMAVALLALPQAGARSSDGRSYVTGYFDLQLDGIKCGLIQKFEGGDVEGEVTTLPLAQDYLVRKQIGNVKYNDFKITMAPAM